MFWQEDSKKEHFTPTSNIQEVSFKIQSKILPIDHNFLLAQALLKHLPWLEETNAGIHNIGVADGNGWEQSKEGGFYYPSKRSKLTLRTPNNYIDEVKSLSGKTLDLEQYNIEVLKFAKTKPLSSAPVLFAKQVAYEKNNSEDEFLNQCFSQLSDLGINVRKMMAGLERSIQTDTNSIHTRSLMLADLKKDESILLQEKGLGKYHLFGCGLFVAQKNISTISS